jgi:hemin uptake protein HemP
MDMDDQHNKPPEVPPSTPQPLPASDETVISSETLFGTQREVLIRHSDDLYRLRITRTGKLILTK